MLSETGPPPGGVFRVGWHDDPLAPPPWDKAAPDGTFGNRFDDPSAIAGRSEEDRFRCIYCGTTAEAAFGETLASFRVSMAKLALIKAAVHDAESLQEMFAGILDFADPNGPARGIVPAAWRRRRKLAKTILDPSLRFADRIENRHSPGVHLAIMPDQPDLLAVARSFNLSIEIIAGNEKYLRP